MKEEKDKSKKLVEEMPSKLSELVNNVYVKKSSEWIKVQWIAIWIGSSMTLLREHQIAKLALWPTSEKPRWINTLKALREGLITTKHWLEIWYNRFCCQMYREVDWLRRFNWSKEDSKKPQRSLCTQPLPRQPTRSTKKND